MLRKIFISLGLFASVMTNSALANSEPSSSGTAFFVNAEGWAITNAHVLEGCVRANAPRVGEATDWMIDRQNDLAAVKFAKPPAERFLRLRGAAPRLGDDIAAFGYPLHGLLSDSIKITTGNINSLVGVDNDTRYLQISTALQPGNSGGPVVDRSGHVLGVATSVLGSKFAKNTGILPQNVNFAIRSMVLELFLQSRGIKYETAPAPGELLSTADLADSVAPTVIQILCFTDDTEKPVAELQQTKRETHLQQSLSPSEVATAFAQLYHDAWSSSNEPALAFMNNVYAPNTVFYGKSISFNRLMEEKRKFAQRWPVRDYSIRSGSLTVGCQGADCTVEATIDWFAYSPERGKRSNGVATFEFRLDTKNLKILSETGKVLKGHAAKPDGMLIRWHERNGKCRGGSGVSDAAWRECDNREYTDKALSAVGWCYGRSGEYGYQMEWHRCDTRSLRNQ